MNNTGVTIYDKIGGTGMIEPTYTIQVIFADEDVRHISGLTEQQVKEICKVLAKSENIARFGVYAEEGEV